MEPAKKITKARSEKSPHLKDEKLSEVTVGVGDTERTNLIEESVVDVVETKDEVEVVVVAESVVMADDGSMVAVVSVVEVVEVVS